MLNVLQRNNVTIIGEGTQTIVFGHGFGCSQNIWQDMIPYFTKQFRMVLFDYVGSGKSDCSAYDSQRYGNLYGYSQDLLEILEALNTEPVIFIGHSVSSMIGLLASIQKPEYFRSLVMISPSPRYLNDLPAYYGGFSENDIRELLFMMEKNYIGWVTANAAALMNTPDNPALAKRLEEIFRAEDPVSVRNFAEAAFLSDHRKELSKVKTATLIIQCSEDSIVPVEAAQYLHKKIESSAMKVISAKGHYPHLSCPEETSEVILDFINALNRAKVK